VHIKQQLKLGITRCYLKLQCIAVSTVAAKYHQKKCPKTHPPFSPWLPCRRLYNSGLSTYSMTKTAKIMQLMKPEYSLAGYIAMW